MRRTKGNRCVCGRVERTYRLQAARCWLWLWFSLLSGVAIGAELASRGLVPLLAFVALLGVALGRALVSHERVVR